MKYPPTSYMNLAGLLFALYRYAGMLAPLSSS
jgi:hypothetical protein